MYKKKEKQLKANFKMRFKEKQSLLKSAVNNQTFVIKIKVVVTSNGTVFISAE